MRLTGQTASWMPSQYKINPGKTTGPAPYRAPAQEEAEPHACPTSAAPKACAWLSGSSGQLSLGPQLNLGVRAVCGFHGKLSNAICAGRQLFTHPVRSTEILDAPLPRMSAQDVCGPRWSCGHGHGLQASGRTRRSGVSVACAHQVAPLPVALLRRWAAVRPGLPLSPERPHPQIWTRVSIASFILFETFDNSIPEHQRPKSCQTITNFTFCA